MHHLGATRSSLKHDHLLHTPDTFIRTPLPGAQGVDFIVHAAPRLGARFTQMTGEQTALRGIQVAALLWFGFVLTTWATEYVYEARPLSLLAINAGFWLPAMLIMRAIVGGWKKKA